MLPAIFIDAFPSTMIPAALGSTGTVIASSPSFIKISAILSSNIISNVSLSLDKENVFETGSFLRMKIYFKANVDIRDILIGFSIISDSGVVVSGTNNKKRKHMISLIKKNTNFFICFDFKKINLLGGRYRINVAIANSFENILDRVANKYIIHVNSQKLGEYGLFDLGPTVVSGTEGVRK